MTKESRKLYMKEYYKKNKEKFKESSYNQYRNNFSDLKVNFNIDNFNLKNGFWATVVVFDKKYKVNIPNLIKFLKTLFKLCLVTFNLNISSLTLIPGLLSIKLSDLKWANPKYFFFKISFGSENVSL